MLRVTEVLSDYFDASMIDPAVLQAAAERGTLVHDICAGILQGFFPPEIQEEAKGYVDSFLIFKEKYIRDVIAVEAEVVHPAWPFVGHVDFAGYLTTEKDAVILDWKTPATSSRTWSGQLAGYLEAARKTFPQHNFGKAGTLQLSQEGKIPKMVWLDNPAMAFHAFICKLQADIYFRG